MFPNPILPTIHAPHSDTLLRRLLGSMSLFTMLMTIPQVLTIWARHRVAFEPVLRCAYHPDDRRDHDGPACDDSDRALVSRLARRFPLSAGNHVHHHLDLADLLRTRKSQR